MAKKLSGIIIFIILTSLFFFIWSKDTKAPSDTMPEISGSENAIKENAPFNAIIENLTIPWDIAFLPDNEGLIITERGGRILYQNSDKELMEIANINIKSGGEGGLLGLTLHPDFSENRFVYLYLTAPGNANQTENRVERYRFENNNTLTDKKVVISGIPGAVYHDGGRMEFGPDEKLYITTGDATNANLAQDLNSLAGKILRLNDDGGIPTDNPFKTAIYSYGHRNPQGLTWDMAGNLWSTEHGPSSPIGSDCCRDELNLIKPGANYGWPTIKGNEKAGGMESPIIHSGNSTTWAPASAAYVVSRNSIFFGGLRGETLYEAVLDGVKVKELKEHFKNEFGRIRTVRLGPDGMLHITTSNRDGRGSVHSGDDKIIRINPNSLN
ncbi:MAG TPA: PQQ-dependent sugar dehydrogenase [Candidatus Paceibacterota bacterium]